LLARRIQLGLLVAGAALLLTGPATAATPTQREASLIAAVNGVRKAHDLRPLAIDTRLMRVARGYSGTLLRTGVLTHGNFSQRMRSSGARGPRFGENLAWGTGGYAAAKSIVRAWMASPGHRANLLRPGFRRIGLGAVTGRFGGYRGATVVTADFAGT
jgi:uncharacterized protein YkwD